MIGLDTNVVVRYLTQDDPQQAEAAAAVIDNLTADEPGYLSVVTMVEVYWVLRRAYGVARDESADLVEGLLNSLELRVGHEGPLRSALTASRGGPDFAEALIAELGRSAGCDRTVTFDKRAARDGARELLSR